MLLQEEEEEREEEEAREEEEEAKREEEKALLAGSLLPLDQERCACSISDEGKQTWQPDCMNTFIPPCVTEGNPLRNFPLSSSHLTG